MALEEAEIAARDGCLPAGAVVVGPDGRVLGRGHNRVSTESDSVAHAEIDAIRRTRVLLFEAPFPDLDERQRVRLDAWRAARGGTEPSWTARRRPG